LQPCAPVRRQLQDKLVQVREKLDDLHRLQHELRMALRSCDKELRKASARCPVLTEERKSRSEDIE
jgi:chromosome segregation ATPase